MVTEAVEMEPGAQASPADPAQDTVEQALKATENPSTEGSPEAAGVPGAETEARGAAPSVFSLSDLTPEQRDELWENDDFKGRRAREQEGASQRHEAKLRRELGKQERLRAMTGATIDRVLKAVGVAVDVDELDARTRRDFDAALGLPWAAAQEVAAIELAEKLPAALFSQFDLSKDVTEAALAAANRSDWDGQLSVLIAGALQSEKGKLTLKDVPEGSSLWKEMTAWKDREVAAELKAKEQEAARAAAPKPGPTVPRGGELEPLDINKRLLDPSTPISDVREIRQRMRAGR